MSKKNEMIALESLISLNQKHNLNNQPANQPTERGIKFQPNERGGHLDSYIDKITDNHKNVNKWV